MQAVDEQHDETTYAAQAAEPAVALYEEASEGQSAPSDRNSEIYSYVTLVAERCHDARMTLVSKTNEPQEASAA